MSNVIRVGVFTAICLAILAVLIWKVEDWSPWGEKGRRVDAVFDSVAGLDDKATVRVAGVRVGRVDGIGLDGAKARVTILLEKPLKLTEGSTASIANLGLLGEKYIELIPGPPDAPPLPANAVLAGITPPSFDQAMAKLNTIGDSITEGIRSFTGGEGPLGGIGPLAENLARTSDEIRYLVAENRAQIGRTIGNFEQVSAGLSKDLPRLVEQLNKTAAQISEILAENRGNLQASMGNVRKVSDEIQTSVQNLNKITDKIASGTGTIGKLVNDEQAHDELVATLDSIKGGVKTLSNTLGAIQKFKLDLDLQGTYLVDSEESPSTFRLDVDPGDEKRLYRVALGSTPEGKRKTKTQTFTTTKPDGSVEVETVETFTREDARVATALFGYRTPRDLRLWAGLVENSGGVSVEMPLLEKKVWLSFDAFDFARENDLSPHLRLTGRWQFHPNLYVIGGYDDPLENNSLFLGAGVRWSDDNLKYLLGSVPKF